MGYTTTHPSMLLSRPTAINVASLIMIGESKVAICNTQRPVVAELWLQVAIREDRLPFYRLSAANLDISDLMEAQSVSRGRCRWTASGLVESSPMYIPRSHSRFKGSLTSTDMRPIPAISIATVSPSCSAPRPSWLVPQAITSPEFSVIMVEAKAINSGTWCSMSSVL